MGEDVACKVCGKLKSQDNHFNIKEQLCNRHLLQLRNHGHFLDNKLIINPDRHAWSDEEKEKIEELYSQGMKMQDIAKELNTTVGGIQHVCARLGLSDKYMRKYNSHYTATYQDYDWCFDHFVNRNMSHQEMADELGVSKRVIQKWCVEIHHIDASTYKALKKLSDIQRQIITVGTLGDGHIDRRVDQPMYIESHAMDEKDYIFWKYEHLKDLCNKPPKYYDKSVHNFSSNKYYECRPYYRINTKVIDDLKEIRSMSKIKKVEQLNEFQFALLMLDDGTRSNLWQLCVAQWSDEEVDALYNKCINEFTVRFKRCKDTRYVNFDALSSKRIDDIILNNVPNDLDIVHKKIIDNINIKNFRNTRYIMTDTGKIGLANYSKQHHIPYNLLKDIVWNMDLPFNEVDESIILSLPEVVQYEI